MTENWTKTELERLKSLLSKTDPASEKYGVIWKRIAAIQAEERKEADLTLKSMKQTNETESKNKEIDAKIELQKIESEWKRKFEEEQFAHKVEMDKLEMDHKIELENNEFDLKSVESERMVRIKAEEAKAKGIDFRFKLLSDLATIVAGTYAKEYLIGKLYLFESEGHVLPSRLVQFLNGLSK